MEVIAAILDAIPDPDEYPSFINRYFTKRYVLNMDGIKNNDLMILFHSNRIALVTLAPSHFFFKEKTKKYKVNYTVGKINRLNNEVRGKGKKGGQNLTPKSKLCSVEFEDGFQFHIPSCIKGKLIEVNKELIENPGLLRREPDGRGYIAIVLSSIAVSDATKNELLTHEDYLKKIIASFVL